MQQLEPDFTTSSPINREKLSRQNRIIYDRLASGETITVYDALGMGIFHLHSRCAELRKALRQSNANLYDRFVVKDNITFKEYSLKPFKQ